LKKQYIPLLICCLLMIVACTVSMPFPATAVPVPTVVTSIQIPYAKIDYYDVSGATEREIRDQLNMMSITDENGYQGDAITTWEIHWNWDGYGSESCDLRSVTATYDIHVKLPRWTPPQSASPELIAKWNSYMLALVEHEKAHVDNVVANLPYVINAIRQATCTTAETQAQAVLAGIRKNDLDYDERTNHGGTQGAIFP
jgi:predicted secreted Zn-dependent protease